MKVLFFTDGPESPGSRFRCLQFFPALRARGFEVEAHFAYDTRYNDVFDRPWAPLYKLASRLKRVGRMLAHGDADVVVLHKTALAFTGFPEQLRAVRRARVVFDFDDAIYLGSNALDSALRSRAFRRVVATADHVVAGNAHLAERAAVPEKTSVIPTVVDTDRFVPRSGDDARPGLVVGWIGTASNFPNLEPAMPQILSAVRQLPGARLRIVSNGVMPAYEQHPLVEHWRWHESRELAALHSFDLGLMPLQDNEQTRGKCGFKMLQYMAVGVPVVASAVGANPELFAGSDAGALVAPDGDWTAPILELAANVERRARASKCGRAHVVSRYSVNAVIDRYTELLRRLAG